MDVTKFFEEVEKSDKINGLGVDGDNCVVQNTIDGLKYMIPVSTINDNDWDTLNGVIMGTRQAQTLDHITRIVGYFSKTKNWNKSKIGELADRREGDYSVS